ncbi:MAG: hypothetical protein ACRDJN_15560, partial [Chloroflexota bacterium]
MPRLFRLSLVLAAAALLFLPSHLNQSPSTALAQTACWPSATPLGALPPARPIWCEPTRATGPATVTQGPNSWLDEFNHGLSTADLGAGYQVFERGSLNRTAHFRHNDHWMVDVNGVDQDGPGPWNVGGATMRPDRTFRFQNGKLVVEADVAAGVAEYGGEVWPELVVTTAPQPTSHRKDGIYNYDEFAGHWTLGCRLQPNRQPICAMFDNSNRGPGETGGDPQGRTGRVFEVSHFQTGSSAWGSGASLKWGGDSSIARQDGQGRLGTAWRVCQGSDPDLNCRDRFRWEIDRDHLTVYVNGVKYMEHAGFPAAQQLPDALVNGNVHVYFGSWIFKPGAETVRFHWDRLAVNPATGPSAAPGFGQSGPGGGHPPGHGMPTSPPTT